MEKLDGAQLVRLRRMLGISQHRVSEGTRLTLFRIAQIETGESDPTFEELNLVIGFLRAELRRRGQNPH